MAMSLVGNSNLAQDLLSKLKIDLTEKRLPSQARQNLLEQLKVLGRNPADAGPIFAREGIETLAVCGFDAGPNAVSREAMRCLTNAMLLNERARQIFLDLDYSSKVAARLQSDDCDDEFLASRILFFLTYTKNLDIETLFNDHYLARSMTENLERHAQRYKSGQPSESTTPPITKMALEETLKLIPNLVYHQADCAPKLSRAIAPITTILTTATIASPPLQPPVNLLINALMNLDFDSGDTSSTSALFPPSKPTVLATRLTSILSTSLSTYPDSQLDAALSPLTTLLRKLYPAAPPPVQSSLQSALLPSETSRVQPLGTGTDLPSRLLKLTTNAMLPLLRDSTMALLYTLSDSDASTLIANVGYGHAAGFLANNGIAVPEGLGSAAQSSASGVDGAEDVNPVTGQRRDAEPEDLGPDMTDEEKEREAERLFVLFERLRATGVVDVENPITRARDEGRFEEIE